MTGVADRSFLAPAPRPLAFADLPWRTTHVVHVRHVLHMASSLSSSDAPVFQARTVHTARSVRWARLACLPLALWVASAAAQSTAVAPAAPAAATPGGHMVAEIQVIPRPLGTAEDRYKHVDAAIAIIQASGLRYEVHALGTVIEGPPEKVWPLLQAVHQATLEAGAERTLSVIKLASSAQAGGPRVQDLVRKFRP